jgi:hypothetical protein
MLLKTTLARIVMLLALVGAALTPTLSIPAAEAAAPAPALLNPNTATEAQLRQVPQLTPALAASIVRERPYATIGDFNRKVAAGLTPEQQKALYAVVFIPIDLNTAPREDIMLIPMTPRMVREFLEYRPYKDMAQFDREIGKYVDAAELARLRSYVMLK